MAKSTLPVGLKRLGKSGASFERFCLTARIGALAGMMEGEASRLCGVRYGRDDGKDGFGGGLSGGDVPAPNGASLSKSVASRRFVAPNV